MATNFVVLTATVRPNVGRLITVDGSVERLSQYRRSIPIWSEALRQSRFRLAVVETSGADRASLLSGLQSEIAREVTIIHYAPCADEIQRGKGAIEMAALDYALRHLEDLTGDSTIYKATGRLSISNTTSLIKPLEVDRVCARMSVDRSWVDTRLVGASLSVWQNVLIPAGGLVDDDRGVYIEHAIASQLAAALALKKVVLARFPVRPAIAGISGSTGKRYHPRLERFKGILFRPMESLLTEIASRKKA